MRIQKSASLICIVVLYTFLMQGNMDPSLFALELLFLTPFHKIIERLQLKRARLRSSASSVTTDASLALRTLAAAESSSFELGAYMLISNSDEV